MKNQLVFVLLLLLFNVTSVVSQDYYYPPQSSEMNEKGYNYYKAKLKLAYEANDYYEISWALANLGEKKEKVFKYLHLAINEKSSVCYSIHRFNKLYQEEDFETTLTKLSIQDWNIVCRRCTTIMSLDEYQRLYQLKINKNTPKIDSSKINWNLVQQLDTIEEKDQRYRKQMSKKLSENDRKSLWKKQTKLDKENLVTIKDIFKKYGYPGHSLVGSTHSWIAFMVIHHYPDIKIKEEYLSLLESAVKANELDESDLNALKYRIKLYYINN